MQGMMAALQALMQQNQHLLLPKFELNPRGPTFNGSMATLKFRSLVVEISDEKIPRAIIDSGATHNFFFAAPTS